MPNSIQYAYYKYYVFVWPEYLNADWNHDRIIETLNTRGTPCFTGSCGEIYLEKAFEKSGLRPPTRLPIARELGETIPMFLVHPTLKEEDMKAMADVVEEVMTEVSL
jgi:dTDP-4-amino-4,6-dideoxygalactose transaminase